MSESAKENKDVLVVFYSLTGNTKLLAENIADEIGADLLELKPADEINKDSKLKFMFGGGQAIMHLKPKLEPYEVDLDEHELILIGTPVWAWTYSPPIRAFLEENNLSGKKTAFFISCLGSPKKAIRNMNDSLNETDLLGSISFIEPLKNDTSQAVQDARHWALEMRRKAAG